MILPEFQTRYIDEKNVVIVHGRYRNKCLALQAFSSLNGEPLATLTVNLEDYGEMPSEGCVFIYGDYAEHQGVYRELERNGVVGQIIRRINYGMGDAHAFECKLLVQPPN